MNTSPWARRPVEERFWEKVYPEPNSGCWLWTASVGSHGYGQMWDPSSPTNPVLAHCVSYRLYKGQIPEGLELDHKCRVSICVNPDHLRPVSHEVNVRNGIAGEVARRMQLGKRYCRLGHERVLENLSVARDGKRSCLECKRRRNREFMRKYYARLRAARQSDGCGT